MSINFSFDRFLRFVIDRWFNIHFLIRTTCPEIRCIKNNINVDFLISKQKKRTRMRTSESYLSLIRWRWSTVDEAWLLFLEVFFFITIPSCIQNVCLIRTTSIKKTFQQRKNYYGSSRFLNYRDANRLMTDILSINRLRHWQRFTNLS